MLSSSVSTYHRHLGYRKPRINAIVLAFLDRVIEDTPLAEGSSDEATAAHEQALDYVRRRMQQQFSVGQIDPSIKWKEGLPLTGPENNDCGSRPELSSREETMIDSASLLIKNHPKLRCPLLVEAGIPKIPVEIYLGRVWRVLRVRFYSWTYSQLSAVSHRLLLSLLPLDLVVNRSESTDWALLHSQIVREAYRDTYQCPAVDVDNYFRDWRPPHTMLLREALKCLQDDILDSPTPVSGSSLMAAFQSLCRGFSDGPDFHFSTTMEAASSVIFADGYATLSTNKKFVRSLAACLKTLPLHYQDMIHDRARRNSNARGGNRGSHGSMRRDEGKHQRGNSRDCGPNKRHLSVKDARAMNMNTES